MTALPAQSGFERAGVSREALSLADQAVIIPQAPGFVDSFNVSVAAALTLYEARSSRLKALGRHGNLSEEQQRVLTAAMLLRHKARSLAKLQRLGPMQLVFARASRYEFKSV